jgi:hypothetical protein
MRKFLVALLGASLIGCGSIASEHVGVRTGFTGKVNLKEMGQGFYTAITSTVEEYTTKEVVVELMDMTPKVADNLSLKDMDLEVYYKVAPEMIAELKLKYTGRDGFKNGLGLPAYFLVQSLAREEAYKAAAKYDSLDIHKNRDALTVAIKDDLQVRLEKEVPGAFTVTNVVARSIVTDPSIEASIKLAVSKEKELVARKKEVAIAQQQALAYRELNASLTPAVLKNKELDIMDRSLESGAKPFLMFGMSNATPLISVNR